jgi:hypothetical protein
MSAKRTPHEPIISVQAASMRSACHEQFQEEILKKLQAWIMKHLPSQFDTFSDSSNIL